MRAATKRRLPMVVLRSNDCCFLGIARGCAAAGIPIVPVVFDWPGAGPWYSEDSVVLPDVERIPNPYEFADEACLAMIELGERLLAEWNERIMIVPSSDTNLMFLLDHYSRLAPYFRLAGADDFDSHRLDVVRKDTAGRLLAAGGVEIPQTLACVKSSDIEPVAREIEYPCVYKPIVKDYGQSFYAAHGGIKAIECHDRESLCERLDQEIDDGFELVVQRKVSFRSVEEEIPFYLYADREHRIRMAATGIKEKIQPFPYGTATVLRLSWHEELLDLAQRVVEALRWRGILMIEFIRDRNDDVWKVIEVNARPWLCVDFYRRSGLNYLQYLYEDWRGESAAWPGLVVPDVDLLALSPVHINLPAACEPHLENLGRPPGIDDVIEWVRDVEGHRSLTFLDPTDPEPGWRELAELARRQGLDSKELIARLERELGDDEAVADSAEAPVLLSVVIPIYRSERVVSELYRRLEKALDEITPAWEILFVEDASPDQVWIVLEGLAASDSRVRAIQLMRNYGQQRAVLCGLAHSRGEFVVTMDDDLQHRPEEIVSLLNEIRSSGADAVIGRYREKQHSLHRRLGTRLVKWLAERAIGIPPSLSLTSFRIMRQNVAQAVARLEHANPVVGYLLFAVTRRVGNVVVEHDERKEGRSNYGLRDLLDYFLCMVIDYSDWPLRAVGGSGFLLSIGSFGIGLYYLYRYAIGAIGVSGFTTLVLLLTFLSGFMLTALGIIGSYLVRILRRGGPDSMVAVRAQRNRS